MNRSSKHIRFLLVAVSFVILGLVCGCSVHAGYYDPYYRDYHHWDGHERVYYGHWEDETHRSHVDFKNRPAEEQNQYWQWRHNQK